MKADSTASPSPSRKHLAVERIFQQKFSDKPIIVRSPGRVNVIGEHTDYNDGFVLPCSIDKAVYAAASKRNDSIIHLYSVSFNETFEVALHDLKPTNTWSTYVLGVVNQLSTRGYKITGFNLVLDGNIPIGAGLSSSAAVESAVVFALNEVFQLKISKMEMVLIAQKAEHTFSGVMCGVMDMFANMFGKKDHVIKLDCRSLAYQYKPLVLKGYKLVLLNTNVKHSLSSSEYNVRRQQCEQGVAWIKAFHPIVKSLRDVTIPMLKDHVLCKDSLIYKRCRFVVEENIRLLSACTALEAGDLITLGTKMFETHKGLSQEYEVSCNELDILIEGVKNNVDVLGARMMGGGFGGCTLNIVKDDGINTLVESLSESYQKKTGLFLSHHIVQTEDGTDLIQ
jgi:galactokinase